MRNRKKGGGYEAIHVTSSHERMVSPVTRRWPFCCELERLESEHFQVQAPKGPRASIEKAVSHSCEHVPAPFMG